MSGGNGVPPRWIECTLEDIAEVHDNLREPVNAKERAKRHGPYPYYGATGQVGWIDGYRQDGEYVLLGEDGAPFLEPAKPKAYMVSGKCWVNNHAHVLRGIAGVCTNRFLMHALNWVDYHGFVTGTTRLKLTQRAMRRLPIVLPPIEQQNLIVAKIDELFSDLDAGVAALERAKSTLKRYRAAVLKAAVHGKLTEKWRAENPPGEPASKLLERILTERRKKWEEDQVAKYAAKSKKPPRNWRKKYEERRMVGTVDLPELPAGWAWVPLGSATGEIYRYPTFYGMEHLCDGVPVIRGEHIRTTGIISDLTKSFWYVSVDVSAEFPHTQVVEGDLVMSVRGSVGKIGIVSAELSGAQVSPNCIRISSLRHFVSPFFLLLWMQSTTCQELIRMMTRSTTISTIKASLLSDLPVPVPPVDEQLEIVAECQRLLSHSENTSTVLASSISHATVLRQCILRFAFEGRLLETSCVNT